MPTRRHEFAMDAPAAGVEDLTRYHGRPLRPCDELWGVRICMREKGYEDGEESEGPGERKVRMG